MWLIGGAALALAGGLVSFTLSSLTLANLPDPTRTIETGILLAIACLAGFLAGAVMCRRVSYGHGHLVPFASVAGAVACGLIGVSYAVALTIGYLTNYSSWPADRLDQLLVLLAYPVFASLGLAAGAVAGMATGALLGVVLNVVAPAR